MHCKSCCPTSPNLQEQCKKTCTQKPFSLSLSLSFPFSNIKKILRVVFVLREDKILYATGSIPRDAHLITSHVLLGLPADRSHHTYRITWFSAELKYWCCANIKQSNNIFCSFGVLLLLPIGRMDNVCLFRPPTIMYYSKTLKCNRSAQVKKIQCVLQLKKEK